MESEHRLKDLMQRGLAGETAAYQQFLKLLSAHLRAFLRRRLAQWPDVVEDLVQEVLLAVHHQRHTYDAALPVTAWAHAIARYKLVDWLRAHKGKQALHVALDDVQELFAATDTEAREAQRDLAHLLQALPERQRLPIVHVKLEGLSVAETAQRTGMTESAVKVGIHRGLKALSARIRGMQ